MADQSDVETALVALIGSTLYPNGTQSPSAIGAVCRVYRGWPNTAALDADVAAGRVHVTVWPVEGTSRATTRWQPEWAIRSAPPTLTVQVTNNSATFGGSAAAGQLAGLWIGGKTYVYRTGGTDTPEIVAAILADAARVDHTVWLAGSTVTVPDVSTLVARTTADASGNTELRRVEQNFRVSLWCPTPAMRDQAATTVDAAIAAQHFISLPDTTSARLRYIGTTSFDQNQDAKVYRRDLVYACEFSAIASASFPCMLFGDLTVNSIPFIA